MRHFCKAYQIIYQGFSLLTANIEVVRHPFVAQLAKQHQATAAQVIFAFARQVGMLPLTGTSDREHMQQDLESLELALKPQEIQTLESIAG